MATKGSFNIFSTDYKEPDRQKAFDLFSVINTPENQNNQRLLHKQTVSKRQNFRNEIRLQKNDQKKKSMRQDLIKSLQSQDFLILMESLIAKDNIEAKNISSLISEMRRNMNDLQFCKKLNENSKIKQFILNLYINARVELPIQDKTLLIDCLIYLTYYGINSLDLEQKQKLNDLIIKEIQTIDQSDKTKMDYFRKLIDLLTNIVSDLDKDVNFYLMDTNLFPCIAEKISQISSQALNIRDVKNDPLLYEGYQQEISDIRNAFISTLVNLSNPQFHHDAFFQFTINQLVNDMNYLIENGDLVLRIFCNFFTNEKYRLTFIETVPLVEWFENCLTKVVQEKFSNKQQMKTGKFTNIRLSPEQRELFYQYINCFMICIDQQEDVSLSQQIRFLIEQNLNGYFLSEFLIQCAGNNDDYKTERRNSLYVSKAIRMYEYLASDQNTTLDQLLMVTSERSFEDILKVLLDETYFTSYRISEYTISLINKMLSKSSDSADFMILKALIELRIFQSIEKFLEQDSDIQTPYQIINFLDLLVLMINEDQDLAKKQKCRENYVVRQIQRREFLKTIQRYQDHKNIEVCSKAQTFLSFYGSFSLK